MWWKQFCAVTKMYTLPHINTTVVLQYFLPDLRINARVMNQHNIMQVITHQHICILIYNFSDGEFQDTISSPDSIFTVLVLRVIVSVLMTGWPLSRQCEIPRHFPDGSRHSSAALGMLSVIHIMPVLVLSNSMDTNMQLTINSCRQLFPDKIFPWHLVKSWHFPDSCQIPWHFQVFQPSGHPVMITVSVLCLETKAV